MKSYFALLRRLLRDEPAATAPAVVIRHGRVLSERQERSAAPSPAKLSPAEAARCFGVVQGGR